MEKSKSKSKSKMNKNLDLRNSIVTFGRLVWLDTLCLFLLASGLALFYLSGDRDSYRLVPMSMMPPADDHNFPGISEFGSYLHGPERLSYPLLDKILPSWACAAVVLGFPALVIGMFQVRLRSWWDFHIGVLGAVKSVVLASLVQTLLKKTVGGFRPHYLAVCKPDIWNVLARNSTHLVVAATANHTYPRKKALGSNFTVLEENGYFWVPPTACTGDPSAIRYALESFPSGHTASSFAAAIYLTLYMNAKLKTFADLSSYSWAPFVTIAPLIGSSIIAGGLYLEHHHHPGDISGGIAIGLVCGIVGYRCSYAALLDFRFNHIPLPPAAQRWRFSYHAISPRHQDIGSDSTKSSDRLVVWRWWARAGLAANDSTLRWLKSVTAFKKSGRELENFHSDFSESDEDVENASVGGSGEQPDLVIVASPSARCPESLRSVEVNPT